MRTLVIYKNDIFIFQIKLHIASPYLEFQKDKFPSANPTTNSDLPSSQIISLDLDYEGY